MRPIERCLAEEEACGDALDFGAGTGQLTRRLARSGRFRSVTGADLYGRAADLPQEIRWIEGDLNEPLPQPPSSFDTVIAAEVIEHLENPRAVCRELFRLLRPGGRAVLSTPNNESWRALVALLVRGHFVAFGETAYPAHITALTRLDLERSLAEAGFRQISVRLHRGGGNSGATRAHLAIAPRRAGGRPAVQRQRRRDRAKGGVMLGPYWNVLREVASRNRPSRKPQFWENVRWPPVVAWNSRSPVASARVGWTTSTSSI